ncbi:MAG: Acetyltransferase [uncultured bacterium]|nr:MAG: Acetyltransferase [uncultured bacterium]
MSNLQFRPLREGDSASVNVLFHQLTNESSSDVDFADLIFDSKCHCVVAMLGDDAIGFGSLVRYNVPSKGEVGRIEDVIIDEKYHGKGFGKEIMNELISIAKEKNIHELNLTCKRNRLVAHKLYESLGFEKRESDSFRLSL